MPRTTPLEVPIDMPDRKYPDARNPAHAAPPRLVGERVHLRAHREDDLPAFFALYSDAKVMRYWSFPAWIRIDQAHERFAGALAGHDPHRLLCWAIAERADDQLIGGITLHAIDRAQGRAEIGYALLSSHWGRGYAREAMRLAIAYAFGALGLRRLEADIDPRNTGSCKLAERMGFLREGLLRERWQVDGEISDSAMYGLLARDWQAHAAKPPL
jgi:RimJ/RimL family protein N-acetyltransferase